MCVILLWCESEKVCSNPALDCYIAKLFELKSLSDKMIKKKKKPHLLRCLMASKCWFVIPKWVMVKKV